jgi:hypothetical protein
MFPDRGIVTRLLGNTSRTDIRNGSRDRLIVSVARACGVVPRGAINRVP